MSTPSPANNFHGWPDVPKPTLNPYQTTSHASLAYLNNHMHYLSGQPNMFSDAQPYNIGNITHVDFPQLAAIKNYRAFWGIAGNDYDINQALWGVLDYHAGL